MAPDWRPQPPNELVGLVRVEFMELLRDITEMIRSPNGLPESLRKPFCLRCLTTFADGSRALCRRCHAPPLASVSAIIESPPGKDCCSHGPSRTVLRMRPATCPVPDCLGGNALTLCAAHSGDKIQRPGFLRRHFAEVQLRTQDVRGKRSGLSPACCFCTWPNRSR